MNEMAALYLVFGLGFVVSMITFAGIAIAGKESRDKIRRNKAVRLEAENNIKEVRALRALQSSTLIMLTV